MSQHSVSIVGHRGASFDAPENTLAAFRLAWEQGADAIEGDFRLTEDGHVVCIHDATTERISNQNLTVADTPLETLKTLDVGSWKNNAFSSERIPTIEEVFATVPSGKKIYIEIKTGIEIMPAFLDALEQTTLTDEQLVVIAFDPEVIHQTKIHRPSVTAHLLVHFQTLDSGDWGPSKKTVLQTLKTIQADGLSTHSDWFITRAFVDSLKAEGFEYHTWTIDEVDLANHFIEVGVQSISTNRPGWLREKVARGFRPRSND